MYMHIVVIGAGAMGGYFGARLAAAGHDVVLYDTNTEHVEAIQQRGLFIEGPDGTQVRYQVTATTEPPVSLRGADLILLHVKGYQTQQALMPLEPRINPESMILSMQNGLGNLEAMERTLPNHQRLLVGTTAHGASMIAPGKIRHAGSGPTAIGDPMTNRHPRLNLTPIQDAFNEAGIVTTISDNIFAQIWQKLAANVAINPISAITGIRNGQVLNDPALLELADAAVDELTAVAEAAGIEVAPNSYHTFARQVMRDTAQNYSSMLIDLRNGRRTEIDSICGAIAAIGAELGVPTPVNRWLTALVKNREKANRESNQERTAGRE